MALVGPLLQLCVPSRVLAVLQGVDVSVHQGAINWTSVKNAGIDFAFTKATEGVDFIDSRFAQNMNGASAAGIPIGPYHFARPNSFNTNPLDAANEANDFVDAIAPYYATPGKFLRPVLDVEVLPGVANNKAFLSEWVRDFAAVVQARLGLEPIIYTNTNYAQTYLEADLASFDLWLARWTYNPNVLPTSSSTGIWSDWLFWQWSDNWTVSGISTAVDGNIFDGTENDLKRHIVGANTPGDYNGDFVVDAADYTVWRDSFGLGGNQPADGDGNGVVGGPDYELWKQAFGSPTRAAGGAAVPEPGAWLVACAALLTVALARRHEG